MDTQTDRVAAGPEGDEAAMTTQAIFDNDAGSDIDDLWALALALKLPQLDLLGVTTVSGDTQARARLISKMLRLAGRPEVPVYAGIQVPDVLAKRGVTASSYKKLTHCHLVEPDDPEADQQYGDAVEFMLEQLAKVEEPITLIGTGPWTNIAEVLRRADLAQKAKIECIALMGGEVRLLLAESNVKSDPEGADSVLKSGVPIFVGTWSATRELSFSMAEVAALTHGPGSPFVRELGKATALWWGDGQRYKPGPVCYDVIPVFWAAGEREAMSCIRLDSMPIELDGTYTRGAMVVHPWALMDPVTVEKTSPEYLTITDSIDAEALKRRYSELVFSEAA
jgi:purine nucleosidase/pyrimidine-specific ribonucleoside hydrolase